MSDTLKYRSFWGMVILPDERYTFTLYRSLHISKAVIDFTSLCDIYFTYSTKEISIGLLVDHGNQQGIILCNLHIGPDGRILKTEADLDLFFMAGQTITLYTAQFVPLSEKNITKVTIHLSGYQSWGTA